MNGFMLLVLVVLAGQVSPGAGPPMPSLGNPVQPASMITEAGPQTDYGWQINKYGQLEYIVQLNETKIQAMLETKDKVQDFVSPIPPVVAARITNIVVRWGSGPIECADINEVMKIPPVENPIAAGGLIGGQFKTLEGARGGGMQNVAGGTQPPTLAPGGMGTNLADVPDISAERMSEAVRNADALAQTQNRTGAGSAFMNEAMGGRPTSPGMAPLSSPTSGILSGAGNAANPMGMPMSTATTPPPGAGAAGAYPNTPNLNTNHTALDQLGPGTGTMTTGTHASNPNSYSNVNPNGYNNLNGNSAAGNYNYNSNPTTGYGAGQSAVNPYGQSNMGNQGNSYPPNPGGMFTSTNPGNTNTSAGRGFGQQPIGTGTGAYPGYGQGPLVQSPYSSQQSNTGSQSTVAPWLLNDPPSLPGVRTADQRNGVPSTSSNSTVSPSNVGNPVRSGWNNGRTDGYTNDPYGDPQTAYAQRTGMENVMPVMFVLSLVVNFYLGMLIRKLLGRYRTLLSSVRSQTV